MRQVREEQTPLLEPCGWHQHNRELEVISSILDERPEIAKLAYADLTRGRRTDTGAKALSADQVVRVGLLLRLHRLTYRELEFELQDSAAVRRFARVGFTLPPKKSALQADIKALGPATWEAINDAVVLCAAEMGIETGRKTRTDTTVVKANIHPPTDSSLLWDCVRVVTRLLERAAEALPKADLKFHDRRLATKRRAYEIAYPEKGKKRARSLRRAYAGLLRVARDTYAYGLEGVERLLAFKGEADDRFLARARAEELRGYVESMKTILDQTERRVVLKESVPSGEKLVSIFETHTDIIVKDNRETFFGHKVCLTGTPSSLVVDCVIEDGNPADSTLAVRSIERQVELYERPPRQAAFDGGFATKANLAAIKALGVKDVAFHKKRGLEIPEMVRSAWVFERLRDYRAGIEGLISALKRGVGMGRCSWRGEAAFKSYVLSCVVSFNLLVIARHQLA